VLTGPLREVDVGFVPCPSGSGALVLHCEDAAEPRCVHGGRDAGPLASARGRGHVPRLEQSVFGYPNDEAYSAVPEATYGFFEVLDSDWNDRLGAFNRRGFPASKPSGRLRHYSMGCHDSSGQFLAGDLSVEVFEDYTVALAEALRRHDLDPG
jgi:hypothetical protein